MTAQEIQKLLEKQRNYYQSGTTIPVSFRVEQLKKLYAAVKKYEKEISEALTADLGKSSYEGFMCEIGLVLSEISYLIRHTKKFARRKTVYTPLAQYFPIANPSLTRRSGLTCPCVISPMQASFTSGFCMCS